MIKRYNAGKDFGKTFMQKAIQKMQEAHILELEKYFYTVDKIACSFYPVYRAIMTSFNLQVAFENPQLLNEIKNELNAIYGEHLLRRWMKLQNQLRMPK